MNQRDKHYVLDRLMSPCDPASEAYGRLVQCGMNGSAAELMQAMQAFHDACRKVRQHLWVELQDSNV